MRSIHSHKDAAVLKVLLARISGEEVTTRGGARPKYVEPVPEPNRSTLLAFHRGLITEELSVARVSHLMGRMYRISIWLGHRPFKELTRDDLIDLVESIRQMKAGRGGNAYSGPTVEAYKTTLQKFWKWLKPPVDPQRYPPEVSWIILGRIKNRVLPKDIWTPDEVNKVASLAGNVRDRAFILGLFGSGCRIGEFLPLRRKDVTFDAYSCQILVDGKTGPRRVRLTPAASVALAAWLEVHPNKVPDAPIWINLLAGREAPDRHFSYDWANAMLKGLARRAGVNKPIRPHLLRHSLATYYAPRLTEAVMNEHFGWLQGGRTASVYTHLSGKQVDDQILAAFGKKKVDPEGNRAVDVVRCFRCGLENVPTSVQCGKCGFPLSEEAASEIIQRRERADEIVDLVTRHPRILEIMSEALARDGLQRDQSTRNRAPAGSRENGGVAA